VIALLLRILILVLVGLLTWAMVWAGRRYVERRRRAALAALPAGAAGAGQTAYAGEGSAPVRILAFSSADCHQCHQFQIPALQRVTEARKNQVIVEEIDAPSSSELTQRYHVLTLPTTVVLDASGRARAVNYGLANTQRLLEQVDEVLAAVPS
jgi:hypothetical protein